MERHDPLWMLTNLLSPQWRLTRPHFCCRLFIPIHSAWRDELQNFTEIAKSCKKAPYVSSGSVKVIEFCANRKGICNFLSVVNSNLGRISHSFGATETYWSKSSPWDISIQSWHNTGVCRSARQNCSR